MIGETFADAGFFLNLKTNPFSDAGLSGMAAARFKSWKDCMISSLVKYNFLQCLSLSPARDETLSTITKVPVGLKMRTSSDTIFSRLANSCKVILHSTFLYWPPGSGMLSLLPKIIVELLPK